MSNVKQQVLNSGVARVLNMGSSKEDLAAGDSDIVKKGYLKKYKGQRSRYFVLRCQQSSPKPATFAIYDSESKFLEKLPPKKQYLFNSNIRVEPKTDSKRANAFSLYVKDDVCTLVAASADEMNDWLRAIQSVADTSDWEHVWHVEVQTRGVGGSNGGVAAGHSYLCLTKRSLSIVSMDESMKKTDIALNTIRMVAYNNMFFYLEMGRMASTGSGRLWLTTQDSNIAANIYNVVARVMMNLSKTMGLAPPNACTSNPACSTTFTCSAAFRCPGSTCTSTSSSTPRDRTSSMSATHASNYTIRDRSGSLPCKPHGHRIPVPGHVCGAGHGGPGHVCGHVGLGHVCGTGHGALGHVCGTGHGAPGHVCGTSHGAPGHVCGTSHGALGHVCGTSHGAPGHVCGTGHGGPGLVGWANTCDVHGSPRIGCQHHSPRVLEEGRGGLGPPPVEGGGSHLATHHEAPDSYVMMTSPHASEGNYVDMTEALLLSRQPSSLHHHHHHHHHCDDYHDHECTNASHFTTGSNASQSASNASQFGSNASQLGSNASQLGSNTSQSWSNASQLGSNTSQSASNTSQLGTMDYTVPSSPSEGKEDGDYLNMAPANATLPKPIPSSVADESPPGSVGSSSNSGAETPSEHRLEPSNPSEQNQEPSSTSSLHQHEKNVNMLGCCQRISLAEEAILTRSNASMETDSIPDVEEVVDDILDGASIEDDRSAQLRQDDEGSVRLSQDDEGSARYRLDSLDHDLDMDLADQMDMDDQVDGSVPSISLGALDSSRTLDTPPLSALRSGANSRGCSSSILSSSVPSSHPMHLHHLHHHYPPLHQHSESLPHQHDDEDLTNQERPIRTSSVGSRPDFIKRKNSTPMLGVSCASRSWSDTSGSYFRNLFSSRSHDKQKDSLMLVDFSKNHKSYDHISNSDDSKDKKSRSIERFKQTFVKHRSSTKGKKRVSEGDAQSMSANRGGGIEIPGGHSDYYPMDFNPSPRSNNSNNSNTSTNSDVPLAGYLDSNQSPRSNTSINNDVPPAGYLIMRPGASLSQSSTSSVDYVDMSTKSSHGVNPSYAGSTAPPDGGYLEMTAGWKPSEQVSSILGSGGDGYVDMTQGSTGLSVSADSSSSGSYVVRPRKISASLSLKSSIELPSPQEEPSDIGYLHELDSKNASKQNKKNRNKSIKENSKRKKSDPSGGESIAESLRNRGSSHLASISSFLTRKNSQSSSMKSLSPTGSPLPKVSRNSSSPFPSLGRSKSKEARDSAIQAASQSPSSGLTTTPGSLGLLTSMSSSNSQLLSPINYFSFMQSMDNPSFRDDDPLENENYSTLDPLMNSGSGGAPRNLLNQDLHSPCFGDGKFGCRCYDLPPPCSCYCADSRYLFMGSSCAGSTHQQLRPAGDSSQFKNKSSDPLKMNVNYSRGDVDRSTTSLSSNPLFTGISLRNSSCNCFCNRHPCSRLLPNGKLPQVDNSILSFLKNNQSQSEMGRLTESSLEEAKPGSSERKDAPDTANYVNMCPPVMERKNLVLLNFSSKSASDKPAALAPVEERKILNTDPVSSGSPITSPSEYLDMDIRKNNRFSASSSSSCSCGSSTCVDSSPESRERSSSTSTSNVVKRPALPQALVGMRMEPSVPLEQLTLNDAAAEPRDRNEFPALQMVSEKCASNLVSASKPGAINIPSAVANEVGNSCCGSYGERFRSHSGPGAPESHNGKDSARLDSCEDVPRRGSDGETRALSACSSPMSYSPPTSPNLASSSKSSLSEGGMSSASSTCTVVNVGLRLQQQQQHANRKSHGSGSSTSTNTDSCSGTVPSSLSSSIINVPSVIQKITKPKSTSPSEPSVCSTARPQYGSTHPETTAVQRPKENIVYASLDLTPPRQAVHGAEGNKKQRHSSGQTCSSPAMPNSDMSTSSSSLNESSTSLSSDPTKVSAAATKLVATSSKIANAASEATAANYSEIDFKKSESLRTACLAARDALRH
ncbi:serine-rich adhesin for platelets isoform X2 [Hyalella azteca]|uniref:Insulin receptor substrate 1 n=1 Tax=Hyalella azteca TaxID=294128 RepID=A0A979FH16_HYAAZ|nr:serine-rich adhesin for platelets isoform X2 [Hyalella azteca]